MLPAEHGPWVPVQEVGPDQDWTVDVSRAVVAAGILENGFYLWGPVDRPAAFHPVIESDRVEGTAVFDPQGVQIGTIRRLDLDSDVLIEDLFRRWVHGLGNLVEIENAYRLDTSIQAEPLSRAEGARGPARTPYRLQFAIEAHTRFVSQTLAIVCRVFGRLWQATIGPLSARPRSGALGGEL